VTEGLSEQDKRVGGMSHHAAAWLAWTLCAVCVVLIALGLLLDFVTDERVPPDLPAGMLGGSALAILTALVGVVRETMQPGHLSLWLRSSDGTGVGER
jgi:hypothetical protein